MLLTHTVLYTFAFQKKSMIFQHFPNLVVPLLTWLNLMYSTSTFARKNKKGNRKTLEFV